MEIILEEKKAPKGSTACFISIKELKLLKNSK
jgi:hypothetical protein